MDKKVKIVALGVVLIALVVGLMAPVNALGGVYGTVYWSDGTPVPGATVTITNLNTMVSLTVTTNPSGFYSAPVCANPCDSIKVEATKGGATATRTVTYSTGGVEVDLTLPAPTPALTPTGIIALVSLLSAIAAVAIVRKRR
jgi:hypothetical protein